MPNWFTGLNAGAIFGPRQEIEVSLVFRPSQIERAARDRLGRYTSAQTEVKAEFEGLAVRLQEMQVEALQRIQDEHGEGRRDQRGTHYLEDAILSPDNRIITEDGFRVGIEAAFQASGAASYWRGLETGTSVHVGQRMWGLWISHDGFSPPVEGGRDAVGFATWPSIPEGEWTNYVRTYKDPKGVERVPKSRGAKLKRLPAFTIKNPIPEYAYLRTGIREFITSGAIEQAMERAIQRATHVQNVAIERGISTVEARAVIAGGA